jgi:hypothetical protein
MKEVKGVGPVLPESEEIASEDWFRDDRTETTILYDQDGDATHGGDVTESGAPSEAWGILHFRNQDGSWVDVPLIDDEVVIGRTDQAHIPLVFDRRVSRVHCILTRTASGCRLIDRGSENGTYVDDEVAEERDLMGGEIIRVGDTSMVFHALSDPTVPVSTHMRSRDPAELVREYTFALAAERKAPKVGDLKADPIAGPLLRASREQRAQAALEAARLLGGSRIVGPGSSALDEVQGLALRRLLSRLLRAKLPLTETNLIYLIEAAVATPSVEQFPVQSIVGVVEAYRRRHACSPELAQALGKLADWLDRFEDRSTVILRDRVRALMSLEPEDGFPLAFDRWGREVKVFLNELPVQNREPWIALFLHARELKGSMTLPDDWSARSNELIGQIGRGAFAERLVHWMKTVDPGPALDPRNRDVLLALIRFSGIAVGPQIGPELVAFALRGYERVPGYGPRSARLGTSAVYAIADLGAASKTAFAELEGKVTLSLGRRTITRVRGK